MISLIQNENMKVYKRTRTWVMIGIAIVYIILQVFNIKTAVEDTTRVNWQLQLEQENRQLSKVAKQSDVLPIEIKQSKRQILLNQYHLDHNIPPSTNGWKFTIDQLRNIVFAATLLSIIIAGEIMAGEYASGTIKLLLTRSASRTQIYIAKYVASLLFALLLATVCVGGAMIFGGMFFGFEGLTSPYLYVQDQTVMEIPALQALWSGYVLQIPFLLVVITLAYMISTAFRSMTFSIVISMLVAVAGFVISIAMDGWEWTRYFIFSQTDLTAYVYGNPSLEDMSIVWALGLLVLHMAVMHVVSYFSFVSRDVK